MEPLFGRAVILLVDAFFPTGQRQYPGMAVPVEDGAFERIKMAVTGCKAVHRSVLRCCSAEVAKVRAVVEIKTRHLVEADDGIKLFGCEGFLQTSEKTPVANMVSAKTARLQNMKTNTVGVLTLPLGGIHMDRVTSVMALLKNAQKVPLKAPVGEIFVQAKRELHSCPDSLQFCR